MNEIELKICDIIDQNQDKIIAFGRDIWNNAEIGFREFETAKKLAKGLKELNLPVEEGIAITGVRGKLEVSENAPTLSIMGELDGLLIDGHPSKCEKTGACHACGHHAQVTAVLGAAMALSNPEIRKELQGNIDFCGVPCEEGIDDETRDELVSSGQIRYTSGKGEWIRKGELDKVDIVLGCHAAPVPGLLIVNNSCNGFVTKEVTFEGKSAHAGNGASEAVDAAAAASIAKFAISTLRESFSARDFIKVREVVKSNNETTSTIADKVVMKYVVRGKSIEAIQDASAKVDRSLKAGAMATGCGLEIKTDVGYLPWVPLPDTDFVTSCAKAVAGDKYPVFAEKGHIEASSDIGDVSCLKPVLQIFAGGVVGSAHGTDFDVVDEQKLYCELSKALAITAYRLLSNKAAEAKKMIENFKAPMTMEEYTQYKESNIKTELVPFTGSPKADIGGI